MDLAHGFTWMAQILGATYPNKTPTQSFQCHLLVETGFQSFRGNCPVTITLDGHSISALTDHNQVDRKLSHRASNDGLILGFDQLVMNLLFQFCIQLALNYFNVLWS